MAFHAPDLHVQVSAGFGSTQGSTGFGTGRQVVKACYFTADTIATVEGAGYFNAAAAELPLHSQLDVCAGDGGTAERRDYVVSGNDGTTVTLTAANYGP